MANKLRPTVAFSSMSAGLAADTAGSGLSWLLIRGLPLILMAALTGAAVGWVRQGIGFIPGVQGLLVGGTLAWLVGHWASLNDATQQWSPRQRFWLWLNLSLTWWFAMVTVVSALYAPPLAGPYLWIREVIGGSASEIFFGARFYQPVEGSLQGIGWIAFNALDLFLFFVLGWIVLGVVVEQRLKIDDYDEDSDLVDVPESPAAEVGTLDRPVHCHFARRLFFTQWITIGLILLALQVRPGSSVPIRFDPVAQEKLQELTGRYVFEDGNQLLGQKGEKGAFELSVYAGDGLIGRSEPAGNYTIRLDYDGSNFRGRIFRNGPHPIYVRVQFSPDGRQLKLAGSIYRQGRASEDVVVSARKELTDDRQ